jgi:hypothetical protein
MTATSADDGPDRAKAGHDGLWPGADYERHIRQLRAALGETVYITELCVTETVLAAQVTDHPYLLLGVIDFPRPDPARGLAPHLILLDDGRGVNLGRIVRVSRRPFGPAPDDILYLDREADRTLLFAERRLSPDFIAQRSRTALGEVLGRGGAPAQARLAPVSTDGSDAQSDADDGPGAGAPKPARDGR